MTDRASLPEGLLLESVVTSLNEDSAVHVMPMGPIVDPSLTHALLRPYAPSQTLDNLRRTRRCVMNVTDDVLLIARAALGRLEHVPPTRATPSGDGAILLDACRWFELEATAIDESQQPALVDCRMIDAGRLRDFIGFNRAKHAVIEATILATRLDFLPHEQVFSQLEALSSPVEKTGGRAERDAFDLVTCFVQEHVGRGGEA